ncbi:hypothetical protein C8F04DRAFT_525341 [Mycena alexandri]|uniref:Uncharacterized protein n=1 Tax=Mycena alexandri TaxID=1745969 RepID=A0AAD6XEN2_9AGAR|nr:hypothetical protein C8F04DRAFT_525341 [Mycena alexandri]
MSSQTTRRTRVASPMRATVMKRSPTPILKRPSPLDLESNSFAITHGIVVVISPATSSPHVHFPATPVLTTVFSTHSPNSYDRTSTKVLPNPLELPAWGQRVYSPGEGNFSSVKSPPVNVPISFVPLAAPATPEKKASRLVRVGFRPKELDKALFVYPRSPYPSAPTSSKNKENTEISRVARTRSLDSPRSRRAMKRPASLNVPVGRPATPRISSSPPANKFLSPVAESPATVTIASTRLNEEFWESVSLEDPDEEILRLSELEIHEGSTPISITAVPRFIFSTKDGLLWSPGLPSKEPSLVTETHSPADWTASEFQKSDRSTVTRTGLVRILTKSRSWARRPDANPDMTASARGKKLQTSG